MDLEMLTQPPWLYVIIAAAVLIVGLIVWRVVASRRRRNERGDLRRRYGTEYDRTVQQRGSERAAVKDLKQREELRDQLTLRDLNDADRELVRHHMATAQYRFVEDPADVLLQAQRVMTEVLRAKGYPVAEDRDAAVRAFSVDHPEHAGSVSQLLDGRHDGDVAQMRSVFLNARRALQDIAGISYVLEDAADRPDLRVEHDTERADTTAGPAPAR